MIYIPYSLNSESTIQNPLSISNPLQSTSTQNQYCESINEFYLLYFIQNDIILIETVLKS